MSENKKEAVQDEMLAERFALSCERIRTDFAGGGRGRRVQGLFCTHGGPD